MDNAVVARTNANALPLVEPAGFGARVAAMPVKAKLSFALGIAALGAVVLAMTMWSSQGDYKVLYANLSDKDGGAIIAQLSQMNVPYRFAEGSGTQDFALEPAPVERPSDAVIRENVDYRQVNLLSGTGQQIAAFGPLQVVHLVGQRLLAGATQRECREGQQRLPGLVAAALPVGLGIEEGEHPLEAHGVVGHQHDEGQHRRPALAEHEEGRADLAPLIFFGVGGLVHELVLQQEPDEGEEQRPEPGWPAARGEAFGDPITSGAGPLYSERYPTALSRPPSRSSTSSVTRPSAHRSTCSVVR